MGITGEIVKSVFSRNRAAKTNGNNVRSIMAEKRKWQLVRSYLCGDEHNSVLAEEDSDSVKSSKATVTQPVDVLKDKEDEDVQNEDHKEEGSVEKCDLDFEMKSEEQAAIVIQTAFRSFLGRRQNEGIELQGIVEGAGSPSRESLSTSVEVQTANSEGERTAFRCTVQQKARTQLLRLKEEWDDSTVSSNISKMRIQNRLEATTRRERALAYAFSQQLRICSKKKQTNSDGTEANMGWSWLERWMATRLPESPSVESQMSKTLDSTLTSNQRFLIQRRLFDIGGEEKESCGSNEVPLPFSNFSANASKDTDSLKPTKNRFKATKNGSRRKATKSSASQRVYQGRRSYNTNE